MALPYQADGQELPPTLSWRCQREVGHMC